MGWSNDKFGIITVQDDQGNVKFGRGQATAENTRVEQTTAALSLYASGVILNWWKNPQMVRVFGTANITSTAWGTVKRNILY